MSISISMPMALILFTLTSFVLGVIWVGILAFLLEKKTRAIEVQQYDLMTKKIIASLNENYNINEVNSLTLKVVELIEKINFDHKNRDKK